MSVGSIEDVLKVVYEPVVRKTFKNHNALSAELKREDVTTRLGEGNYVHISLELSEGAGAGGRPEFGELPKAVPGEFIHSRVQVKYLYAPGAISGPALKKAQSSRQALINSLAKEVENTYRARQAHVQHRPVGGEHGAIAEIDNVTATNGGSPWELELTEDQPFYGRYFKRGERLQFGSVTGGVATVEPGVVKVTAIDRANRTITVETVSGSRTRPPATRSS